MKYENWIDEENLKPFLEAVGWLCDYKIEESDWQTVLAGVKNVDEDKNVWFEYTLKGKFQVMIAITMASGSSNYTIRIEAEKDISMGLGTAAGLAQCYRMVAF